MDVGNTVFQLRSNDPLVQLAALQALATAPSISPEETEAVVALLASADEAVAAKSLELAPRLHCSVVLHLQDRLHREQHGVGAGTLLRKSVPSMIQTLSPQLATTPDIALPLAARLLFYVPTLVQARRDEAKRFAPALNAVAAFGGESGAKLLGGILLHSEPPLIAELVSILAANGQSGESIIVAALSGGGNEGIAKRVAESLILLEAPTMSFVSRLVNDSAVQVRECGVIVLSQGRSPAAASLELLAARTKDSSMCIVIRAILGIEKLLVGFCRNGCFATLACGNSGLAVRDAIHSLVVALADSYSEVKEAAAGALIRIRDAVYENDHSHALTPVMPPLNSVLSVIDACLRDMEKGRSFGLQTREQVTLWLITRCGLVEGDEGKLRARNALLLWAMSSEDIKLARLIDEALTKLGAPPNE